MSKNVILPLEGQILLAMKMAENTPEAAEYLLEQYTKIVGNKVPNLIQQIKDYVRLVKMTHGKMGEPWTGQLAWLSKFQNMQASLATAAAESIQSLGVAEGVQWIFVMDDESRWLRGYSDNEVSDETLANETLDDDSALEKKTHIQNEYDSLFNAWLASKQLVSKDNIIYEADINGKIKETKQGKVRVDPEQLNATIEDLEMGYNAFLAEKGLNPILIQKYRVPNIETIAPAESPAMTQAAPKAAPQEAPEVTPSAVHPKTGR